MSTAPSTTCSASVMRPVYRPPARESKKKLGGPDMEVRIAFMGPSGVGKTSLVLRMMQNVWRPKHDCTVDDRYRKVMRIDDEFCVLDVMDFGGRQDLAILHPLSIPLAHGFVLIYSISSRKSFEEVKKFRAMLDDVLDDHPLILVGNKCDEDFNREVTYDQGRELAASIGCCCFMESSARNTLRTNVNELFVEMVRAIRKSSMLERDPRICVRAKIGDDDDERKNKDKKSKKSKK